jgi:hypothetical protein
MQYARGADMFILNYIKKLWHSIFNRKSLIKLDDCIFYDVIRDRIIIRRPFKRPIVLHNKFRENHQILHIYEKSYSFFDDHVKIDDKVVYFV